MNQNNRTDSDIYISVVTTALNEQENLPQLMQEIHDACESMGKKWEAIITNDGSTDNTEKVLRELMDKYPQLRVLKMARRSGQSNGFDAGIRRAHGYLVATMDADLQNDPAEIPKMVELLEKDGWDMVNGWRQKRQDSAMRLISTKIANGVRNRLTHENIRDSACGLKVFNRHCMDRIKMFDGMHRFMPTLVKNEGFKVTEVQVNHRPRVAGEAKYGVMNRVFRTFRDCFAIRWMQSRTTLYQAEELER